MIDQTIDTSKTEDHTIVLSQILNEYDGEKKSLIPLLQTIQERYNYLPPDILQAICDQTEITPDQVMGVASFYSQFRLKPTGEHIVKVCTGTACHVKRSNLVHDAMVREMSLEPGEDTDANGKYTLEKVNCVGCCTLAPVVLIDETTYGYVNSEDVGKVFNAFEYNNEKEKTRQKSVSNGDDYEGEVRIALDSCCVASGTEEVMNSLRTTVAENGMNVKLKRVGCVGMCHQVPMIEIVPNNGEESTFYSKVGPNDVSQILNKHFRPQSFFDKIKSHIYNLVEDVQTDKNWGGIEQYHLDVSEKQVTSFFGRQVQISTEYLGTLNPLDINEYKLHHGFFGLKNVLTKGTPEEMIEKVKASGLRGRGGGGFPTWIKWDALKKQKSDIKYVICNGDEGDPGAFMDRMLLESYPFRVIEGMIIAAYATQTNNGYFYIRAEYPKATKRIGEALKICRELGYLGENILDSGFSFDIELFKGAGAFICGEETALIASIEGDRGFPSLRPPYPVEEGLWGKPTLVNNVETFAQVPYIARNDIEKYTQHGTETSKGTKVFALAGKINNGGLIEVPMGVTIREIVEEIGGGIANGKKFKAVQIGGPSGGCIPHWMADTSVDYDSLKKVGAMVGSGGMIVLDEDDCMVDIAKYFLAFTQHESCGKCTFCRVGTKRMLDILTAISEGRGK